MIPSMSQYYEPNMYSFHNTPKPEFLCKSGIFPCLKKLDEGSGGEGSKKKRGSKQVGTCVLLGGLLVSGVT